MRLINIICTDKESFKYSVLLYIYYYNIKKNRARVSQLKNNINVYMQSKFFMGCNLYKKYMLKVYI